LGTIVGGAAGGPLGAAAGAVGAPLAGRAFRAVARRIRHREVTRATTGIKLIGQRVSERVREGDLIRDDGFFGGPGSAGSEAAEGVIRAAMRDFEDRKLPLLAELISSLAFNQEIDPPTANQCVRLLERLSYRQL
jgi:hypothetical protein